LRCVLQVCGERVDGLRPTIHQPLFDVHVAKGNATGFGAG
jgi:hypothetical protein